MKKRMIAILMAGVMLMGMSSAVFGAEAEDPILTGEKPQLNILVMDLTSFDMNEDPIFEVAKEITGYDVVYHQLAAENSTEKMLMDIASGAEYDLIINMTPSVFTEIADKNVLMDVGELLDKYGQNILANLSDAAWGAVGRTEDGTTYAIPTEATRHYEADLTGAFSFGLAFRNEELEALGMEIPTNLDEFYNVLTAYKEKTGNAPLTLAKTGWVTDIMSAFGMGGADWYVQDGVYTYKARHEGLKGYIEYMQKLYSEGLLDTDMPIDTSEVVYEKFINTALCTELWFWEIPNLVEALVANNPEEKIVFATCLGADENTPGLLTEATGIGNVFVIPKTAKNPEHAINYLNTLSDMENYKRLYIGEENVSYEVIDGKYYPIFPAFNDYGHANNFVGVGEVTLQGKYWEARARKTPEMAEAFDQMNENANDKDFYFSAEAYASGVQELAEYFAPLEAAITDIVIKGIVEGTDAQAVIDEIIEVWERDGGLECEAAMQEWYLGHQDLFVN